MDNANFLDKFFKVLVLLFWPIIWFKWQLLADDFITISLFTIYLSLSIVYLILLTYSNKRYKNIEKIVFLYRLSTLSAFLFTLLSFLLFPKNLFLLFLKMVFILIYFYCSFIKVYKYHIDEGVVGVLSALLLTTIAILY